MSERKTNESHSSTIVSSRNNDSNNRYIRFVAMQPQFPSDVDPEDAVVLVDILLYHLPYTRFRRARTYSHDHWNDMIRYCNPIDGRITQLSLFGFDSNNGSLSTKNNADAVTTRTLLSRLEKLERLELRHCRSLPINDLPAMKSLKWLNLCIVDTNSNSNSENNSNNFLIPNNRDWYPPNLKTFLIYGYKVKGDPLDSLIAASIVMRSPPIDIEMDEIEQLRHNTYTTTSSSSATGSNGSSNSSSSIVPHHPRVVNDIQDLLLSDGIGPFVKYDERNGRISELRLSSVGTGNRFLQRSAGVDLPLSIGRLEMLKKLYLYNVSSVPAWELSNLLHLRVLRLDGCSTFSMQQQECGVVELPNVVDVQLRTTCGAGGSVLSWITLCFPNLRSLEILNMDPSSLDSVFQTLGGTRTTGWRKSNTHGDGKRTSPTCFGKSLAKLHISATIPNTPIPGLEKALFGILHNHPNLSKLYVERVITTSGGGDDELPMQSRRNSLESIMAKILEHYPRVRGLSIGGPNILTFDNRCRPRPRSLCIRRKSSGVLAIITTSDAWCDTLLNLNKCGRVLLNKATAPATDTADNAGIDDNRDPTSLAPSCNWIPVSTWSRVLERAQKIVYAGNVRTKKDRTTHEMSSVYFLLRNGPALALREQFGFEFIVAGGRTTDNNNRRIAKNTRKRKCCWK